MFKRFLLLLVVLGLAAVIVVWFTGKPVTLRTDPQSLQYVGQSTPLTVHALSAHGAKFFQATIEQNGQSKVVFEDRTPSHTPERLFSFDMGKKSVGFLKEGSARLTLTAQSNDLRGATTTQSTTLQVLLQPPNITADGVQHYINQGGAELVTFDVGGAWTAAGVKVGPYTVTSYPMPGQPDRSNHRFSLFPYSWDLPVATTPFTYVQNATGTQSTASFWTRIFPKKFHDSTIKLDETLMRKIVSDIDPEGKIAGSIEERFLYCNRELRKQNNQLLHDLRSKSAHRILWSGAFVRPPTKNESFFADRRTYVVNGKIIDHQVHLGFDLASTAHMPIRAANSGKVLYAQRLGIYGNCIVLDHGYGLQTIYGHLSRIDVKPGDDVAKDQQMGLSGQTGMAGGDHLHFSMQVDGVQVNPTEWWDEHWIHDRVLSKIGPAR